MSKLFDWFRKPSITNDCSSMATTFTGRSTMILHSSSGSPMSMPWPFGGGWFRSPESKVGPTPLNAVASATSLRLVKPLVRSYFQRLGRPQSWARFSLFGGGERGEDLVGKPNDMSNPKMSMSSLLSPFFNDERRWTNVLLALNVAIYVAQVATQGKLMFWGAKINDLVDEGQMWRLVTSAFLHANIGHLLVNCYSLNAVGPSVEKISGPGRFLAVYFASAITCSTASYFFSENAAVGASGAIFGLVGSMAVFIMRHRHQVRGGKGELQHIMSVIALNMAIGLMSEGIDNWGHLGGLLGGAAASWLLGPAFDFKTPSRDGRRMFADKAPIFYLINWKKRF